jgi:coenzyme F420 hydrogenase subunit beta
VRQISTLKDVVDWGLCIGCGACHYQCERGAVSLVNIESVGIRPRFEADGCGGCTECLSICPGYHLDGNAQIAPQQEKSSTDHEFGPALEIWEGYASDPEIRYKGSSGGVLSALALYCVEREGMNSVSHTGRDEIRPWINKTVNSKSRAEIVAQAGSRYAPASPCDGLRTIEDSDGPCVFIGKPCDAAAVNALRRIHPDLDRKLGLVLTFFCAGTPSTEGTLNLLQSMKIAPQTVTRLNYRGEGWPGAFKVLGENGAVQGSLTYTDSWSKLTGYRPLRCNLCPDGLGRVADISCGDAWHRFENDADCGRSLILVRTERGKEILRRARAAGYIELAPVYAEAVMLAQASLLQRRRELYGRLLAMKLLFIPTPRFLNFSLLRSWLRLPLQRKAQTLIGTMRRAASRGWWRRRPLFQS